MKKRILHIMLLAASVVSFTACDKETEGVTRITYYPSITVLGDATAYVNVGDTYTDAGCEVLMNGEDVTESATTTSTVDTTQPGIYSVTYSATNADGFSASASRTVYVLNPGHLDNVYLGESEYGTRHYYDAPILITQQSDGTYLIDDVLGGFYFNGRYPGYEPNYDFHAEAVLTLNSDNTLTLESVGSWYFDDTEIRLTSGTYDPTTGNVSMTHDFGGAAMYVNLTPMTAN